MSRLLSLFSMRFCNAPSSARWLEIRLMAVLTVVMAALAESRLAMLLPERPKWAALTPLDIQKNLIPLVGANLHHQPLAGRGWRRR